MATKKSKPTEEKVVPLQIVKPTGGFLEKYRTKKTPTIGGVETLLTPLPILKLSDARDFVRVSADESHWSPELCFVSVPIQGEKRDMLHLIDEEIAVQYLPSNKIRRFRLVLATKPYDIFFLAQLPTTNLDNPWNSSALKAFEQAKVNWIQVTSRKAEGVEAYKIDAAQDIDAFPDPKWPSRSLEQLIETTFHNATIETHDHPALLRLIGARQNLK